MNPFRLLLLEEVASTNEEVKRALDAGEPEGLVVRARRQAAGYGRQGRTWTSPEGGLYCSLLLRPQAPPAQLPTLSLVAGLAVRRALAGLASGAGASRIQVKWPNDVVCHQGKLCGISLEGHGGGVCVGVGVNVRPPAERPDVGGKNRAAYVADFADASVDGVLDAFLSAFAPLYSEWERAGFGPLVDEFNDHASLTGHDVRMVDREGAVIAAGEVERVDACGRLLLRDAAGAEIPVASGEAHLA